MTELIQSLKAAVARYPGTMAELGAPGGHRPLYFI